MPHILRKRALCVPFLASTLLAAAPNATLAGNKEAIELGKQVFTAIAEPKCAICHTLADAGAAGKIGPDLDEMKPTEEKVRLAVAGGLGAMAAYRDTLTPEQIDAVALYVSQATDANEQASPE